jgi:hypothetical protein
MRLMLLTAIAAVSFSTLAVAANLNPQPLPPMRDPNLSHGYTVDEKGKCRTADGTYVHCKKVPPAPSCRAGHHPCGSVCIANSQACKR